MAHYKVKGKSRLSSRTSTTDPRWLKVASQIGRLVNDWSSRDDLVVYGGEDSAEGQAIAAYYADISEIELNISKAFGAKSDPERVGDFNDKGTRYEFPDVSGVLYHEALHAKHTNWDIPRLVEALDNTEGGAFMLLEESRIEAKGVIERPENRLFLRQSALKLALEEVTSESLESMGGEVWQVATLAGLSLARYDAKVLEREDVLEIYRVVVATLGEETYSELRKVWVAFQALTVPQVEQAIVLAKRWVEILRSLDPEGEPNSGSAFEPAEEGEGEESESGEGDSDSEGEGDSEGAGSKVLEALKDSEISTTLRNNSSLGEQETQENREAEAEQSKREVQNRNTKREKAQKIFKHQMEGGSGSSSKVHERRQPTGAERASAVSIAKALEKAKYRERSVHIRKSQTPMGKLIARNVVHNKAMESRGLRGDLPAWKQKVRKHTDDPTLRLGVMVDISGSMGSAMEAMATTAWVLGEAGRRIQAETAMVYYGSGVFPTLKRGQRLSEVTVYTAPDGTEKFGEAWSAIDGELGLTFGDGVRMLVIVSDGQYTSTEQKSVAEMLQECKRNGVAVLWVTPEYCYGQPAKYQVEQAKWGVHLDQMKVGEIASTIGKSASEALARVGSIT